MRVLVKCSGPLFRFYVQLIVVLVSGSYVTLHSTRCGVSMLYITRPCVWRMLCHVCCFQWHGVLVFSGMMSVLRRYHIYIYIYIDDCCDD